MWYVSTDSENEFFAISIQKKEWKQFVFTCSGQHFIFMILFQDYANLLGLL